MVTWYPMISCSVSTGKQEHTRAVFQKVQNMTQYMIWSCSKTLGVCVVVCPLRQAINSTWHLFPKMIQLIASICLDVYSSPLLLVIPVLFNIMAFPTSSPDPENNLTMMLPLSPAHSYYSGKRNSLKYLIRTIWWIFLA